MILQLKKKNEEADVSTVMKKAGSNQEFNLMCDV